MMAKKDYIFYKGDEMKLREFNFNSINGYGLAIHIGDKPIESGYIGEVLNKVIHLADYEIENTNYFFDMFVIRLKNVE